MEAERASVTAQVTAFARAWHARREEVKIFDDRLAVELFTEAEWAFFTKSLSDCLAFFNPELAATRPDPADAVSWIVRHQNGPITLSRSRYAEDRLEDAYLRGVRQYVILGAGLDTFAFRRPDSMEGLSVLEVDHPATQDRKRRRLAELGWKIPEFLGFLPLDFARRSLAEGLAESAFDPRKPAFFNWLGVTYYLDRDAVMDTLRTVSRTAGNAVVFDYLEPAALEPEHPIRRVRLMVEIARRAGEPMRTSWEPSALKGDLEAAGLRLLEDLGPAEIQDRFFRGRVDGYRAFENVRFALAETAGA